MEGRFNGGFLCVSSWGGGLLFGAAYTWRGLYCRNFISFECLITFIFNFFNAGFQSRYTSIPSKPTISHAGNDVTFTWRYHLTHSDRANFKFVVFGKWMNGDISIPLVSVLRNGSAIFYSKRVSWLGNKTIASFRLHKVSIDDDRVYGCKLDFGAFDVLDSVRLTVIGKNVTINLPLFIPFL